MNEFNFNFIDGLTDFQGIWPKMAQQGFDGVLFWPDYTLMFITSGKMAKQKD